MNLYKLAASSFKDEVDKIASAINLPVNYLSIEEIVPLLHDSDLFKEAATRAVKEWRKADAAGDGGTADAIAKGYGQAGLKPRYLNDVSIGGAEAGVDRMMGDVRHSTGQLQAPDAVSPRRELYGRLDQMKSNKAELGVTGRAPSQSVKASPEGRAALLRGTQPATPNNGPAPNESGYAARKMYKPDSFITQAEFTPQHLQQKMDMTQAARNLSPEAKSMVPDMYGHTTSGTGPTQRSMSYHEFVPGMQDLRGKNIGKDGKDLWTQRPQAGEAINNVKEKVLQPLAAKGMTMGDVSGERGTNWGNVARAGDGSTKIVDFLPTMKGQQSAGIASFGKYAPMPTMRHSVEGGGSLGDLRKEMYKPTMESRPASPEQVSRALDAHRAAAGGGTAPPQPITQKADPFPSNKPAGAITPSPVSGVAPTRPAPAFGSAPTAPAAPPASGAQAAPTTAPMRPPASGVQSAPTAVPRARPVGPSPAPASGMQPVRTGAATPGAMRPPATTSMPTRPAIPIKPMLPTKPALGGLHR